MLPADHDKPVASICNTVRARAPCCDDASSQHGAAHCTFRNAVPYVTTKTRQHKETPSAFAQSRVCPHRAACATVGHTVGYALPCCAGSPGRRGSSCGRRCWPAGAGPRCRTGRYSCGRSAAAASTRLRPARIDRLSHSALCQVSGPLSLPAPRSYLAPWGSHLPGCLRTSCAGRTASQTAGGSRRAATRAAEAQRHIFGRRHWAAVTPMGRTARATPADGGRGAGRAVWLREGQRRSPGPRGVQAKGITAGGHRV